MCTRAGPKLELERFRLPPFLETAMKTLADAFEHTLQDRLLRGERDHQGAP